MDLLLLRDLVVPVALATLFVLALVVRRIRADQRPEVLWNLSVSAQSSGPELVLVIVILVGAVALTLYALDRQSETR